MTRHQISWDDVKDFEVDDVSGALYWNGRAVRTERRITLKGIELALASVAAAGTALTGLHSLGVIVGWW